jgi:hypothetical protein
MIFQKKIILNLLVVLSSLFFLSVFTSCLELPFEIETTDSTFVIDSTLIDSLLISYPQTKTMVLRYNQTWDQYFGGSMQFPGGSSFEVNDSSFTPPLGTSPETDVMLSVKVELDTSTMDLVFTLGPAGCSFLPPANAWLVWKDLKSIDPEISPADIKFFEIDENGIYSEITPALVNNEESKILVHIHNASRYALSYTR